MYTAVNLDIFELSFINYPLHISHKKYNQVTNLLSQRDLSITIFGESIIYSFGSAFVTISKFANMQSLLTVHADRDVPDVRILSFNHTRIFKAIANNKAYMQ